LASERKFKIFVKNPVENKKKINLVLTKSIILLIAVQQNQFEDERWKL
jgi:hypothetical protein